MPAFPSEAKIVRYKNISYLNPLELESGHKSLCFET